MPGCFLCYKPPAGAPPIGPLPCATRGYVTFVSFNNIAKLNDKVLDAWSRVLEATPKSRLLLKNKIVASPAAEARLVDRLARRGVAPERVDLSPLAPKVNDHLAVYARADISLDTFPYAGTTTTCEALLMGIPVVTLVGPTHAHNVGCSILSAIGLPELVARTEVEYVEIARALASDVARLGALRATMRERMLASPLCDGPGFTRRLEREYDRIWRALCQNGAPRERARPRGEPPPCVPHAHQAVR